MKVLKIGLIVCVVMFLGFSQAFAGETYMGLSMGKVFPGKVSTDNSDYDDINLNKGTISGLKVGWRPLKNVAYEFEYNYITGIDANGQYLFPEPGVYGSFLEEGKNTINAFMFNFILRNPDMKIMPYVGIGAGFARTRFHDVRVSNGIDLISPRMSDSDTTIASQFLAGIESKIDEHWSATLGYKYFYTNPDFSGFDVDATYRLHMATVGLNYTF